MKHQQSKNIASACAYLDDPLFKDIVYLCDLECKSWDEWYDPAGSKIKLTKNHHMLIRPGNPGYSKLDLYCKSHPISFAKHSSQVLVLEGVLEDVNYTHMLFLGKDQRLRAAMFVESRWEKNYPPVMAGNIIIHLAASMTSDISLAKCDIYGQHLSVQKVFVSDNPFQSVINK